MALTDFQTKKFTHLFNLYDTDHNGTINGNDYERRVQFLAENRGLTNDTDGYKALHKRIMMEWEQLCLFTDIDGDGKIAKFEFLDFAEYILSDESLWNETSLEVVRFVMQTYDTDGDGKIDINEFSIFLKAYGLSDENIKVAFDKLDIDGDGVLIVEEIINALDQFGKSNNPDDRGNYMFGHLD